MFDAVIVGGGLAGLYTAFRLPPTARVAIVEREATLGGRARVQQFAGATVPSGAGIGRKAKDVRLQALAAALNVPVTEFPVVHTYARGLHCTDASEMFGAVKAAWQQQRQRQRQRQDQRQGGDRDAAQPPVTFAAFAKSVLGAEAYARFVTCSGFTDYERADAADVVFNYGFEDNSGMWTGLAVPWAKLIEALRKHLVSHRNCVIVSPCAATKVLWSHLRGAFGVAVTEASGRHGFLRARAVVLATDIHTVRALLPNQPLYRHVHSQPFTRLYAEFRGRSAKVMQAAIKGVTAVPGPLQKIIRMTDTVFMVAYADNASAVDVARRVGNPQAIAHLLEDSLGLARNSLTIHRLRDIYFRAGTHYNDPGLAVHPAFSRDALQCPHPGLFVVGEAVAVHQGWVEGALESVDAVLPRLDSWIAAHGAGARTRVSMPEN
jgi:glycine/D-amino acid oxidase-like deaminating enzyme